MAGLDLDFEAIQQTRARVESERGYEHPDPETWDLLVRMLRNYDALAARLAWAAASAGEQ